MKFLKKILERLKNPGGVFLAVLYTLTVASATGAILITALVQLEYPLDIVAYVLYAVAAVTLGLSVYTLVRVIPKIGKKIKERLHKIPFIDRLMVQYGFRTIIFAIGSLAVSVAYALFNGVIAVLELSIWYGSLAAYYLLLAVMRGVILFYHRTKRRHSAAAAEAPSADDGKRREILTYRTCGGILVFLPICLSFAILQMVIGKNSFEHAGMMIYVSAIYAFYKITMSIVNIFKAHKNDDLTVRAIRCVNLADAFVSILALQTAMFKEYANGANVGFANALTGGVVCALTAALGIFMIVNSAFKMKELRAGKAHSVDENLSAETDLQAQDARIEEE